ncbi:CYTH domain-containing protein [Isobaculum melis]|uniref:Uncharacterized protein YjbK n=1 Tax=Isobaculum melis TaxID=142588 RepID=A0A1H9T980_9LACT|nr:CYTH domain-containing protein [Isobaculum melis]SER93805.1 Uncharacterized protein YjbK [Isobaculum melis]
MSEQLEIEFKNLLTEPEYKKLIDHFQLQPADFFSQENFYFDTSENTLKQLGAALRIRCFSQTAEATLKTPHENGLLEITDSLTLAEAHQLLAAKQLTGLPHISEKLATFKLTLQDFQRLGSLKTTRAEKRIAQGLLVFDQSDYNHITDYELEFEVANFEQGQAFFAHFLAEHHIPIRKTPNKVARMFLSL